MCVYVVLNTVFSSHTTDMLVYVHTWATQKPMYVNTRIIY